MARSSLWPFNTPVTRKWSTELDKHRNTEIPVVPFVTYVAVYIIHEEDYTVMTESITRKFNYISA